MLIQRLERLLPRSLVGRVFALYTATLLAFVLGGLGLFYRYQFSAELDDALLRADVLNTVIAPTIADSAVIGDYDTIRRTLSLAMPHSSLASASFIDLHGGTVRAPNPDPLTDVPPAWLLRAVAAQLFDSNQPITAGGRDYGVLRLSFAPERVAGRLWQQIRVALLLGLAGLVGGLVLIRVPLVRWLGKLGDLQVYERAMASGQATPALRAEDAPLEFRETFAVLDRAAANLQSQRAQAAVTLAAIGDAVFTLDDAGRLLLANPAAVAMTGLPLDQHLGEPVAGLLPQLVRPDLPLRPWAGLRATLTAADGRALVLDTTLSPIRSPQGEVQGHVLACRDISAQHALQQQLEGELASRQQALVALRQVLEGLTTEVDLGPRSDDLSAVSAMIQRLVGQLQMRGEQLNAIFALSPDGFVSFDAQRRVHYVSPAFARLTGLPEAQVLGADEAAVEALLRQQCAGGTPWRPFAQLRHERLQAPADEPPRRELIALRRPVHRVLELGLREGSTGVISQVLSLRDVTHETEVDQMKSEFLSTAAHELRTPMASIFGFAELMMSRPLRPEQQQDVLATIHRQTALMIAIVNELLDLARIEARRGQDFELQTLDLATLAAEVLHDFKPPQQRLQPVLASDGAPAPVHVDRNKLAQALGNVLSNAFKYSPTGGAVQVQLLRETQGGSTRLGLAVQDRGIGMTPAQLARVGERFYRADASGNIPGTGLGMAIVREILELHGGSLSLASTPGQGSTVTLWLPQQQAPAVG